MFTFDRVVCINLARRPGRWAAFQDAMASVDWPFGEVERIEAIDGERCTPPHWFAAGPGAWGVAMTNLLLIQDAINRGLDSLLIFEDDMLLADDFGERAPAFFEALPEQWDGLYLGGEDRLPAESTGFGNEQVSVMRARRTIRTHAYALRPRYMKAAYALLTATVDWARHGRMHFDQRLAIAHGRPDLFIYEPSPWLVGQRMGEGDITAKFRETNDFWQERRTERRGRYQ